MIFSVSEKKPNNLYHFNLEACLSRKKIITLKQKQEKITVIHNNKLHFL